MQSEIEELIRAWKEDASAHPTASLGASGGVKILNYILQLHKRIEVLEKETRSLRCTLEEPAIKKLVDKYYAD